MAHVFFLKFDDIEHSAGKKSRPSISKIIGKHAKAMVHACIFFSYNTSHFFLHLNY